MEDYIFGKACPYKENTLCQEREGCNKCCIYLMWKGEMIITDDGKIILLNNDYN